MNKLNIYIILLAATFMLCSCDGILDTEPKQEISEGLALDTPDNVKAVLVGAYNQLGDGDVWGGLMQMQPDLLADEGDVNWTGTYEQPRQIFLKEIQANNSFVADAWLDAYATINTVNGVLSAIDVVNEEDRGRVQGEALFIRGSLYFELARLFGKAWNDGDPSGNLAVPLVTTYTTSIGEESEIPRNTVQEVYSQAISDLTEAKNLLPETNDMYATTYAASAILARIYLQQGNYSSAAEEANRVIESGEFALVPSYADIFNNVNTNTSEDIFAMQVTTQDGANSLNTFYASEANAGRGDIEIQDQHLNKYESGDERLDLFYTDEEGTRSGKWQEQYGNVNIIRLAEMYLIRAESNFRTGTQVGPNTPGQDLSMVRNRVGLADNLNPSLQDILDERYLELAFEGHFLHDKKRLEQDVGSLSWSSPKLVYPIPLREINANGVLTQNDGYGGSN